MHDALKREHMNFRDAHVAYTPPDCYWRMLNAFVPLEFGSTVRRMGDARKQIVFVQDTPILPDLYQSATGIDTRAFVGLRVVSINGAPVLDYFRRYAEQQKTHEDDGGGLNGVLANFEYSARLGGPYDFVPERAADTYVFESVDGRRQVVALPWLFALSNQLLGDYALPPSANSEGFVRLCQQGPAAAGTPTSAAAGLLESAWGLQNQVDRHRHQMVRHLRERHYPRASTAGYFEVAPERLGQDMHEIIPITDQARVVQHREHVTAIQLRDTVAWTDVARQGVEYACEHSDRLIVDVRNNNGGNDTVIRWLHHYLFPEAGNLIPAGLLPLRLRNDNPVFNEVLFNFAAFTKEFAAALTADPCEFFLVPGCLIDVNSGATLPPSKFDWFLSPTERELRGGRSVSLSRQFDSASCAGKFAGDDLVLLTNGCNASGGYFLPAAFKGDGVIVNTGGIVGEPMAMGRARGGATAAGSVWLPAAQEIESVSGGTIMFKHELVGFQRPVETQMEMLGAYREDRKTLHINDPVEADLHVDVWTNQTGSEGFVYERVLRAVDELRGPNRGQ